MGHLHPALKVPRVLQLKAPTASPGRRDTERTHPAFLTVPLSTILVFTLRCCAGKKNRSVSGSLSAPAFYPPVLYVDGFQKSVREVGVQDCSLILFPRALPRIHCHPRVLYRSLEIEELREDYQSFPVLSLSLLIRRCVE